jgi:DNA replication protein DnaC
MRTLTRLDHERMNIPQGTYTAVYSQSTERHGRSASVKTVESIKYHLRLDKIRHDSTGWAAYRDAMGECETTRSTGPEGVRSFILCGPSRSGKTSICTMLLIAARKRGWHGYFVEANKIRDIVMTRQTFDVDTSVPERLETVPVLVIDGLEPQTAKVFDTPFSEWIATLMTTRTSRGRLTWITTTMTASEVTLAFPRLANLFDRNLCVLASVPSGDPNDHGYRQGIRTPEERDAYWSDDFSSGPN